VTVIQLFEILILMNGHKTKRLRGPHQRRRGHGGMRGPVRYRLGTLYSTPDWPNGRVRVGYPRVGYLRVGRQQGEFNLIVTKILVLLFPNARLAKGFGRSMDPLNPPALTPLSPHEMRRRPPGEMSSRASPRAHEKDQLKTTRDLKPISLYVCPQTIGTFRVRH
jgi:hypothetical protein